MSVRNKTVLGTLIVSVALGLLILDRVVTTDPDEGSQEGRGRIDVSHERGNVPTDGGVETRRLRDPLEGSRADSRVVPADGESRVRELFAAIASDARNTQIEGAYVALTKLLASSEIGCAELTRVAFTWLVSDSSASSARLRNVQHVYSVLETCRQPSLQDGSGREKYCKGDGGGPTHIELRDLLKRSTSEGFVELSTQLVQLLGKSQRKAYDMFSRVYANDVEMGRALLIHVFDDARKKGATIPLFAVAFEYERAGPLLSLVEAVGDRHNAAQLTAGTGRSEASIEQHLAIALRVAANGAPFAKEPNADRVAALHRLIVSRIQDNRYSTVLGLVFAHSLAEAPANSEEAKGALAFLASDRGNPAVRRAARRMLASRVDPVDLLSLSRASTNVPSSRAESLELVDLFRAVFSSYKTHETGKEAVVALTRQQLASPGATEDVRMLQRHIIQTLPPGCAKLLAHELHMLSLSGHRQLARVAEEALRNAR